jgi:hypothetical protein
MARRRASLFLGRRVGLARGGWRRRRPLVDGRRLLGFFAQRRGPKLVRPLELKLQLDLVELDSEGLVLRQQARHGPACGVELAPEHLPKLLLLVGGQHDGAQGRAAQMRAVADVGAGVLVVGIEDEGHGFRTARGSPQCNEIEPWAKRACGLTPVQPSTTAQAGAVPRTDELNSCRPNSGTTMPACSDPIGSQACPSSHRASTIPVACEPFGCLD